jgi:CRISPR-associated endonuclease/helicase Cas3
MPESFAEHSRLREVARLCGLAHDFGKYTTFFQERFPPLEKAPPKKEYGHHSFISALLAAYAVRNRYPGDLEARLLAYLAVHRHHGRLVAPSNITRRNKNLRDAPEFHQVGSDSFKKELRAVHAQLGNIGNGPHRELILAEMSAIGLEEVEEFLSQERWWELLAGLHDDSRKLLKDSSEPSATKRYWSMLVLFSALIDADKYVSADPKVAWERPSIPSRLVDEYIRRLKPIPEGSATSARLGKIRNTVYRESNEAVKSWPVDRLHPATLSLTAPTGSGKTLTALGCALRLRERLHEETGHLPRIIYALPFVNIIDQNYEVTKEVLSGYTGSSDVPSTHLLKHHHLAPLAFSEGEFEEDVSNDDALLLTESWESEIIVTTFVQLFESLVSSRNRSLKKLHNVAGSIVVLDEIQSIPREQWKLIGHTLTTLSEHLGCTVLQMTATRPRILPSKSTSEILPDPEKHFNGLSRTHILPRPDLTSIEDIAAFVEQLSKSGLSTLAVFNTIGSSVDIYKALRKAEGMSPYREYGRRRGGCPLFYLSTNLTPWQRARRVRLLKKYMRAGGKPIVVSTQVIEAGVDLDFDTVVRDRGPLDSIVQVAGRCNRSGEREEPGSVYIVRLERDNGRSDAEAVYGRILPEIADRILSSPTGEAALYEKLDEYFSLVIESTQSDKSADLIEAMRELRFSGEDGEVSVGGYRHIESLETVPILVEINSEAYGAIKELERHLEGSADRHILREAYRRIGSFVITPNKKRAESNMPSEHPGIHSHRYITHADTQAEYPSYYDLEVGFIWDGSVAAIL